METIVAHQRLPMMAVFAQVVEHQSFSAAARVLGMSKSRVSKLIAELELALGAKLLRRTTRSVSTTELGTTYYQSCARVLAEVSTAEHAISELQRAPVGTLRVNAPIALGGFLVAPAVGTFLRRHPDLKIELTLQDDLVDLIATRTDLVLRVGQFSDSSLIARRIRPFRRQLVASPEYLARQGTPRKPSDLTKHEHLLYSLSTTNARRIELFKNRRAYTIPVDGRFTSNNGEAHLAAASAGLGIALLPEFYTYRGLADGSLIQVLPEYQSAEVWLHALYAPGTVTAKQRLFLDFLISEVQRACPSRGS